MANCTTCLRIDKPRFMVREHTRDIKGAPGHSDHKDYFIYISGEINDYYQARQIAIDHERNGGYSCCIELIGDDW
jgi:hypothetical protein